MRVTSAMPQSLYKLITNNGIDLTLLSLKFDDGGGHWDGRKWKQKYFGKIRSYQNRDGCRRWENIRGLSVTDTMPLCYPCNNAL